MLRAAYPTMSVGEGASLVVRNCTLTFTPALILSSVEPSLFLLSFYVSQKPDSQFEWRDCTLIVPCSVRPHRFAWTLSGQCARVVFW